MNTMSDGALSPLLPLTIREMIDRRVAEDAEFVYCRFGELALTMGELDRRANCFANGLLALGIKRGDRVAVMLPNHPDYVVAFLAAARIGVCQVPVNINLRGAGLAYVLEHSRLRGMIVDSRFAEQVTPVLKPGMAEFIIGRGGAVGAAFAQAVTFDEVARRGAPTRPPVVTSQDDPLLISYTSGTTGVPKGVLVTDKMLQACGFAATTVADVRPADVLYLWEPIYHIAGCEVLIVALLNRVTLALAERFSVSRFWSEVRGYGATHIHFFGGVLGLLLKEPPAPGDREHGARIAWGGGCPISIWTKFQDRFGVRIRECYGMTEASSFTTVNTEGKIGSVGKPLPYFEVRVVDDNGHELGPGQKGEIWVKEKDPGVIMTGYFGNAEATASALKDGWLRTGDLGYMDDEGFYYFSGRKKESFRRRGENISAWEVERVLNEHPAVAECAVIGVESEFADQDIKAFLRLKPGEHLDALDLVKWCGPRMATFQIPRYVAFIDEFPKTPTERIRKEMLPRATEGCFDLEKSGHRPKRAAP